MRNRHPSVLRVGLLLPLLLAGLVAACTSTGENGGKDEAYVGPPTQVSWLLFKSGQVISLVNDSHSDRLELYSEVREHAGPKVTSDEVMDGLVDYLKDEQNFDEYAHDGPAPAAGNAQVTQALELRIGDRVSHMLMGPGSSPKEREAFLACAQAVGTIWNATFQLQAVENDKDKAIFEQPGASVHYKN